MDELDAGLHVGPGPVVGDGSRDPHEPQRPSKHTRQKKGIRFNSITRQGTTRNREEEELRRWKGSSPWRTMLVDTPDAMARPAPGGGWSAGASVGAAFALPCLPPALSRPDACEVV